MKRFGTTIAAALAILALGTGAASAATPIDLGAADGAGPGLAITPTGSAALSYTAGEALRYCRVDPGGSACAAFDLLPSPISAFNEDLGNRPLIEGSKVRVLETRREGGANEDKFLWSGEPFGSATTLGGTSGTPGSTLAFGDAVLAPAGTVNSTQTVIATVQTGPGPGTVLAASGTAAASGPGSVFHLTTDNVSGTAVGLQGSMLSAVYIDQALGDAVEWRRYNGTGSGTPAAVQTAANWTAATKIGEASGATANIQMIGGPAGLYVAYQRPGGALAIQRFNGLGFDPAVPITGEVFQWGISEDGAGLIHVVYSDAEGGHYKYAKDASNAAYTRPQALPASDYRNMQVATTAAGTGWASWWDDNTKHDFVYPLAPGEPPLPTNPPAPGGGGTPPKKSGKKTTETTASLGHGLVAGLTVPKECVPGGQVFKAKVGVKRKGSAAHKASYTVKKVGFFLGKKKISTDKKKPFEVGFATKGVKAGAALAVSAKISVLIHQGHKHSTVAKTLKASVRTCK